MSARPLIFILEEKLVGAWIEFNDKMRRYIDITDEITVEKCGEHTEDTI